MLRDPVAPFYQDRNHQGVFVVNTQPEIKCKENNYVEFNKRL